jgi:hypothetical protein
MSTRLKDVWKKEAKSDINIVTYFTGTPAQTLNCSKSFSMTSKQYESAVGSFLSKVTCLSAHQI